MTTHASSASRWSDGAHRAALTGIASFLVIAAHDCMWRFEHGVPVAFETIADTGDMVAAMV